MKVKDELKELRDKDLKTLFKLLAMENEAVIKDKTALVEKKLKDIKGINKRRKKIARIWTTIREKTIKSEK